MLGFASHVEVCGIAGICGICGICGTDHLLEITPAGLPFLGAAPPIQEGRKMGTENNQRSKKRMLIFDLTCCLSII
jgi:hypothetical protein